MASKGGKISQGGKISYGSSFDGGKSNKSGSSQKELSYWELQLEAMNRDQLREKAKDLGLKTRGSKVQLKNRIKTELMEEKPIEDKTALQNIPEGSITSAHFEEEKFQVSIIDQDIEPHIEAESDRLGEGVYSVKQKPFVGEEENLIVTVSDPSPYSNVINNNIMTKTQSQEEGTSPEVIEYAKLGRAVVEKEESRESQPQLTLDSTFEVEDQTTGKYWNYSKKTGKKTSLTPFGRRMKAIDDEYDSIGLNPFFAGRSYTLIDPDEFKEAPREKHVAESGDKLKALGIKDGFSLRGNQIQTRVNKQGEFEGFYYQSGSEKNPMPQFVIPEVMVVDSDPLGHFQAKILQDYSGESFDCINSRGEETEIDDILAYKGFSGNVTDSRGFRRANIVRETIKAEFGESSLSYIPPGTSLSKDVSVSDQQIAVVSRVYSPNVYILVSTPEKDLEFRKQMEDIPDPIEPCLIFEPIDSKVREVNSDDLLKAGVRKIKTDPITIQAMLQALYKQKWINYPRANQIKAEDEPIHVLGTDNAEEARQRVEAEGKWVGEGFKGSVQERQLLEIIVKSQEANERGENYIDRGNWVLYTKDVRGLDETIKESYEISSKPDVLFQGEQREFIATELEIGLGERGVLIEDLTDFVIDENLVTPATRTKVLQELKNAGILIQRQDRFVIDKRGLMMFAVDEFYNGERADPNIKGAPFERSHQLKTEIFEANSFEEINEIAVKFDMLSENDKIDLKRYLKKRVDELLEIEEDLAELDSF